jgi:hypothetical protein
VAGVSLTCLAFFTVAASVHGPERSVEVARRVLAVAA